MIPSLVGGGEMRVCGDSKLVCDPAAGRCSRRGEIRSVTWPLRRRKALPDTCVADSRSRGQANRPRNPPGPKEFALKAGRNPNDSVTLFYSFGKLSTLRAAVPGGPQMVAASKATPLPLSCFSAVVPAQRPKTQQTADCNKEGCTSRIRHRARAVGPYWAPHDPSCDRPDQKADTEDQPRPRQHRKTTPPHDLFLPL